MLIFEFSQQAVARGGQAIFTDINLYWEVPKHFESVPAIGPGGEYTGKTYADYLHLAQKFVWLLFEVFKEGDGVREAFLLPQAPGPHHRKIFPDARAPGIPESHLRRGRRMGNTYFVFDRGQTAKISECCRLSFKLEARDLEDAKEPWRMRYCALQNVTLNLPRIAYEAGGDDTALFSRLADTLELAVEAHLQKRAFIQNTARNWGRPDRSPC